MRIAFLGLGHMGSGMARRLIAAGHSLTVFNRTAARSAPFAKLGARVANSPCAAAQKADVIIGMTADDESSRAMWLGGEGALAADNSPDALAIECSTLSHDWVLELAQQVRGRGFRYVDAPVTGLPESAAAGTLTLLVGAEPADLDAARPTFASLAARVLHFGTVGQGTVYKLMINLMGAVQIASAAEGMVLAERAGLDLKLVADAIASGQAASPQVVRNVRRFVAGEHGTNVNFTPALRLKDIDYALLWRTSQALTPPSAKWRPVFTANYARKDLARITKAVSLTRSVVRAWHFARIRVCRPGRRPYRGV